VYIATEASDGSGSESSYAVIGMRCCCKLKSCLLACSMNRVNIITNRCE